MHEITNSVKESTLRELDNWLKDDHSCESIFQIYGGGSFELRSELIAWLKDCKQHRFEDKKGLVVQFAQEVWACLAGNYGSDATQRVVTSECLVIMGLEDSEKYWNELIPFLALRGGFGQLTVLVDEKLPSWTERPEFRQRVRGIIHFAELAQDGHIIPTEPSSLLSKRRGLSESVEPQVIESLIQVAAGRVAKRLGVHEASLLERTGDIHARRARQVAIFVARKWRNFDFAVIGRVLGERAFVSASQAYRRIEREYLEDPEFKKQVDEILSDLNELDKEPQALDELA